MKELKSYLDNCFRNLPNFISTLRSLIANLTRDCSTDPTPQSNQTLDQFEKELAQALVNEEYCNQTKAYVFQLYTGLERMFGHLWAQVYGIEGAVEDGSRFALRQFQPLDLDSPIFGILLTGLVNSWADGEKVAYSMFYYACRDGLL